MPKGENRVNAGASCKPVLLLASCCVGCGLIGRLDYRVRKEGFGYAFRNTYSNGYDVMGGGASEVRLTLREGESVARFPGSAACGEMTGTYVHTYMTDYVCVYRAGGRFLHTYVHTRVGAWHICIYLPTVCIYIRISRALIYIYIYHCVHYNYVCTYVRMYLPIRLSNAIARFSGSRPRPRMLARRHAGTGGRGASR